MTTLSRAALVVAAAVSLSACDFLEKEPQASLSSELIFNDPAGAEAAINGAYSQVQGPTDDYIMFAALASEIAQHTGSFPSWSEVDNHQVATNNAEAQGQWTGWYSAINQANIILENIGNAEDLDPERAAEIRGEALAIRAYSYHNLVKWFGGVPLIFNGAVDFDNLDVARSSEDEVYAQIITDLREAINLVADVRANAFIDKDAARALLARVLLFDGQYEEAGQIARDVISRHPLAPAYTSLFDGLGNDEVLWGLQYTVSDSNALAFFALIGGRYEYGPTQEAFDYFNEQETDERFDITFGTEPGQETIVITKYDDAVNGTDPVYILRSAEMYLIAAEAAARAGNFDEAVDFVNDLRERAGISLLDNNDGQDDVDSVDEAIDLILAERVRELAYEGHRWFDLVRTNRAVALLPTLTQENFTRWPIPRREIDLNQALVQNPGY
jgi:hypothetical protein